MQSSLESQVDRDMEALFALDPFFNNLAEKEDENSLECETDGVDKFWSLEEVRKVANHPDNNLSKHFSGTNKTLVVYEGNNNTTMEPNETTELERWERSKRNAHYKSDEEMAHRLQFQEFRNASSLVNPTSSNNVTRYIGRLPEQYSPSTSPTNQVQVSQEQLKEMAEEQVGKENIRILSGFTVVKFGREGKPQQRKMWINSAFSHLAWKSRKERGFQRGLDLTSIRDIKVGLRTRNISRITSDVHVVKLCFSLITDDRTVDLQACSVIQRDVLVEALKGIVKFSQKYRPRRKGNQILEITLPAN